MKTFKIKDSVDLRILKDYGFNLDASSIQGIGTFNWGDNYVDDNFGEIISQSGLICIDDTTRKLLCYEDPELLFRLINDGLVEITEVKR